MIRPPEPEDLRDFARRVVQLIEELGMVYAIGGSMAAMEYGEPRLSIDVDLMLKIDVAAMRRLIDTVESWGVYVTPWEVVRSEMLPMGRPFNIIDGGTGSKVDLYVVEETGLAASALRRRVRRIWDSRTGEPAWFLAAEDVILYKLRHYRDGGEVARKHPEDITRMIRVSGDTLDLDYLDRWSEEMGTAHLWRPLRGLLDDG